MRLPAWTSLLGPPVFAAVILPLLVLLLALAVPRAGGPRDASNAGGTLAKAGPATPAPAASVAAPAAAPADAACSPMNPRAAVVGDRPASARLNAVLGRSGELSGRRLEVGTTGGRTIAVSLPADSFAAEPSGGWLVYGLATRGGSEVRAVSLDSGCDARLARIGGMARGALLAADGSTLYVHSVDAATRADGGLTSVDLASGSTSPVVPSFDGGAGFGPVYATELAWSSDGSALAVQSCGAEACQTRLLDIATGDITTYGAAHGSLVGVTSERLYVFEAGHERPAALLAISRADGVIDLIAAEVFDAELAGAPGAPALRFETSAGWQEVRP